MDTRASTKKCYGPLCANNFNALHLDDTLITEIVTRLDSNNYKAAQRKLPIKYALAIKVANNETDNPLKNSRKSGSVEDIGADPTVGWEAAPIIRRALKYDLEKLNDMLDGDNIAGGINPADE